MISKYLLSILAITYLGLSQGTVNSSNFQLYRLLLSGEPQETNHYISLDDNEITQIRENNLDFLKEKLEALDLREEQVRYGHAITDSSNVKFDGNRLIINHCFKCYATFRPIEFVTVSCQKLRLQILDPRIFCQVGCVIEAVQPMANGSGTVSRFFCNSDISNRFFYAFEDLNKVSNFHPLHAAHIYSTDDFRLHDQIDLVLSKDDPLILDDRRICISDWVSYFRKRVGLSELTNILIFAEELSQRMKVTTPQALLFLSSLHFEIERLFVGFTVWPEESDMQNSYYYGMIVGDDTYETQDISVTLIGIKFTTDTESDDWYSLVGKVLRREELEENFLDRIRAPMPQNGRIHSIVVGDKEFCFNRGDVPLTLYSVCFIIGAITKNLKAVAERLRSPQTQYSTLSCSIFEELYNEIKLDEWLSHFNQ